MSLTFPIDTKEPEDLPEFYHIFEQYSTRVPDLSQMLRWLCYRFDPKSPVFAKPNTGFDECVRMSDEMAGWKQPVPLMVAAEDGSQSLDFRFILFQEVMGEFFMVLDNDEWESIVTLGIAIHNGHMVIREPLPTDMDPETKGKVLNNIYKAIEGNAKAQEMRKAKVLEMAKRDELAVKSILAGAKAKAARANVSPEGQLNG